MSEKASNTTGQNLSGTTITADWQQHCMTAAAALGSSWYDFIGERFHAYAHAIDDVSHCHDLAEAWRIQTAFGQNTVQAYSEQGAKIGQLIIKAANGNTRARQNSQRPDTRPTLAASARESKQALTSTQGQKAMAV